MEYITFFCLAAKLRSAQKKYYAANKDDPNKRAFLINSKKLETLFDYEIDNMLTSHKWQDIELKKAWEEFLKGDLKVEPTV